MTIDIDPESLISLAKTLGGWILAALASLYAGYQSLPIKKREKLLKWGNEALEDGTITISEAANGAYILASNSDEGESSSEPTNGGSQ